MERSGWDGRRTRATGLAAPPGPPSHPVESLEPRRLLSVSTGGPVQNLQADPVGRAAEAAVVSMTWKGQRVQVRKNEYILRIDDGGAPPIDPAGSIQQAIRNRRKDVTVRRHLGGRGTVLVETAGNVGLKELERSLRNVRGFRYVEPNLVYSAASLPNDPRFANLWGIDNTGQTVNDVIGFADPGTAGADVDGLAAWAVTRGDPNLVVGVIDSGVKYNHPDLAANMWRNPGEVPDNRIDDDANGFIDDVHGWDFVGAGDSDPMDQHGHGTHVAGTIAAVADNGVGVAGLAPGVKIMALRFLDSGGSGDTDDAVEALNYAVMMKSRGVNIRLTNNSWGGYGFSQALHDAIDRSGQAGMLFVAAAGNDNLNNDVHKYDPASSTLPNVISVAATDNDDGKGSFSSYGAATVDLGAPGVSILSTAVSGAERLADPSGYKVLNGTSMAAPHVSAAAALAWSMAPAATAQEVRGALLQGGDAVPSLAGRTVTGRRLNAAGTLRRLGLSVAASTPAGGSTVSAPPTEFTVRFSHPVAADAGAPGGVQPGDFAVNGVRADAVALDDDRRDTATFRFDASPVTAQGVQTMSIEAGAVRRASDDNPVAAWSATFLYDAVRMQVASTTPAVGATVPVPEENVLRLRLHFNEPYDPATTGLSDLTVSHGTVSAAEQVDATTVEYTIDGLASVEMTFRATMPAGAVTDLYGNPAAAFSASYNRDVDVRVYDTPFRTAAGLNTAAGQAGYALVPQQGEGITPLTGFIGLPDDTDHVLVNLEAGQGLTVVVSARQADDESNDPLLRPTAVVYDPDDRILKTATAAAPGGAAIVQSVPVEQSGVYRVAVGSFASASTGAYTVRMVLNATVELEEYGGLSNSSPVSAQGLDPAFWPVADGFEQAAVVGHGPGEEDYFGLNLAAGQALSVAASNTGIGTIAALELYRRDPFTGPQLVAEGADLSISDGVIDHFVAPAAGNYLVRVKLDGYSSTDGAPYLLVVNRGAGAMDLEPDNNALLAAAARPLGGRRAAVGNLYPALLSPSPQELEPNDDRAPGAGPADLARANDLSRLFARQGDTDDYRAAARGQVAAGGPDADWDFFRFHARPGDRLSARLAAVPGSPLDPYLRLYDSRGVELAADDNGGGGTAALVRRDTFDREGDYYLVADGAGASSGVYDLVATLTTAAAGGPLELGDSDFYAVSASAGDVLRVQTRVVGIAPGLFNDSGLDPRLELYGPAAGGTPAAPALLAADDDSAPDGRNADLAYAVPAAGTYYVRVTSPGPDSRGFYVLTVSGATGDGVPPNVPLAVAATTPAGGSVVGPAVPEILIDFTGGVLPASLAAADLTVGGRPATGFRIVDGDTVAFAPPPLDDGAHDVALAAGAVTGLAGQPLAAYAGRFTLDNNGPRVVESSVRDGDTVPSGDLTYTVRFDEPLRAAGLDAADFVLAGAASGLRPVAGVAYDPASAVLTLRFTALPDDAYTLTLLSGDGWLEDGLGNDLDGETVPAGAGALPSGNGHPGGHFVVRFGADAPTHPLPAFQPRSPAGSLVYESGDTVVVGVPGDVEEFTLDLEAGQVVGVSADPVAASPAGVASLRPVVELFDAAGAVVAAAAAPVAGRGASFQAWSGAAGAYRVRLRGGDGTTGPVALRVLLNAAPEAESHGGPANDGRATAQDLDAVAATLPGGSGAARAAAVGSLPPATERVAVASEDFESGLLPFTWRVAATGRIRLTGPVGAGGGSAALWMDRATSGPPHALNQVTWPVDLTQAADPVLRFDHAEYGDESDFIFSPYTGEADGDGVSVSVDGSRWYPVWQPVSQEDGVWATYTVNLRQALQPYGVAASQVRWVKFQQYDEHPLSEDGRGWDNLAVTDPRATRDGADWYAVSLAARQPLTAVLAATQPEAGGANRPALEVYGAVGGLLETGEWPGLGSNVAAKLQDFLAPAAGTYYVRVVGSDARYTLSILKGAEFDAEPNDSLGQARNLDNPGAALGQVGLSVAPSGGLGAGAPVGLPFTLIDGSNYQWNMLGDGTIADGSFDAYDGALTHRGFPVSSVARTEDGGREVVIGPSAVNPNVRVTRKVYVPADRGYARFLEVITNVGPAAARYEFTVENNLGSDGAEAFVRTSSGDGSFTTADDWIVTDDASAAGDPTLLHVIGNPGAPVRASAASKVPDLITYSWDLTLAPGETRIVMHFASQNPERAGTLTKGQQLARLELGALAGMSEAELLRVVNFALTNPRDYYWREVRGGESVTARTFTPGDAPGGAGNTLDPRLEVWDVSGNLLASDEGSAPDGRNAALTFTPAADGAYYFVVATTGQTGGEYVLEISPAGDPPPPPHAPSRPDLLPAGDTGLSDADDLTRLDNGAPGRALRFLVTGTVAGATVTLFADGQPVGSAVADGPTVVVATDGALALADGPHSFTVTQAAPAGAAASAASAATVVTVDTAAPQLAEVTAAGSAWSPAFLARLKADGSGDGGWALTADGGGVPVPLPWANLDRVKLRFSEPMTPARQGAAGLVFTGVTTAPFQTSDVTYDAATRVATWRLSAPLTADKRLVSVAGWSDAAGNPLPADTRFRLDVLPGDVDGSGRVLAGDLVRARAQLPSHPGLPAYDPRADVNGSAGVLSDDVAAVRSRLFTRLPAADPAAPAASAVFSRQRVRAAAAEDEVAAALA